MVGTVCIWLHCPYGLHQLALGIQLASQFPIQVDAEGGSRGGLATQIITTNLGLSDSDRPRLVVVIWVGTLFLAFPHPYRLNGAIMGASAYLFWTDHTKNISHEVL